MKNTLLYGWKTGALEPPEQLQVEEALRDDPVLLSQALALPDFEPERRDPWRLPLHDWRLQSNLLAAEVFGRGLRPGDRFRVGLQVQDPAKRAVVVLRRRSIWSIVFPGTKDDLLCAADLPQQNGEHMLDLTADDEQGLQVWGVALPLLEQVERSWERLQAAMRLGEVPMARFQVEVT